MNQYSLSNTFLVVVLHLCLCCTLQGYVYNGAPLQYWESLEPYFLPEDHPIKPTLDKIFYSSEVTYSTWNLRANGFEKTLPGKYSKAIVTQHPKLKGYYLKLYVDIQPAIDDAPHWLGRVTGAEEIRTAIDQLGYQDLIVVPKKWVYPLPPCSHVLKGGDCRKHFVLIAEDMDIVSKKTNLKKWKSPSLSKTTLAAVYVMISTLGLSDSVYAFNLPFTKTGKIAMIDTEFHHKWPIHFSRLKKYLSEENKVYWQSLVNGN